MQINQIKRFVYTFSLLLRSGIIFLIFANSLFAQIGSYVSDLKAIRAILDSNGLFDTMEEEIAFIDKKSRRIIDLNLSKLKMNQLPEEIGLLGALQSLDLSRNKLVSIPKEIGQLSELVSLNLSRNRIKSIPKEIGRLNRLKTLLMSFNQIQKLPEEFGNLTELEQLMISKNLLSSLPPSVISLAPSTYVSFNNLCALPAELEGWLNDFSKDQQWKKTQNCEEKPVSQSLLAKKINTEPPSPPGSQLKNSNKSDSSLPFQHPPKSTMKLLSSGKDTSLTSQAVVDKKEFFFNQAESKQPYVQENTDDDWILETDTGSLASKLIFDSAKTSQPTRVLPDSAWDILLEPDEGKGDSTETIQSSIRPEDTIAAPSASIGEAEGSRSPKKGLNASTGKITKQVDKIDSTYTSESTVENRIEPVSDTLVRRDSSSSHSTKVTVDSTKFLPSGLPSGNKPAAPTASIDEAEGSRSPNKGFSASTEKIAKYVDKMDSTYTSENMAENQIEPAPDTLAKKDSLPPHSTESTEDSSKITPSNLGLGSAVAALSASTDDADSSQSAPEPDTLTKIDSLSPPSADTIIQKGDTLASKGIPQVKSDSVKTNGYKSYFELQKEDAFFKENITMEMIISAPNNALFIFKKGQLVKKFVQFQTIDFSWLPSRTKKGHYFFKATVDGVTMISHIEI